MPRAESAERLVDRGRVVREVVVDGDVVGLAEQILTPPHALERSERGACRGDPDAEALRAGGDGADRVTNVVRSRDLQRESPAVRAAGVEIERLRAGHGIGGDHRAQPRRRHVTRVVALEGVEERLRLGVLLDDRADARIACITREETVARHQRDELLELRLVRCHRRIDVDVILLDAREDHDVVATDTHVVEELGPLVPVDGVVLVALDDERRGLRRRAECGGDELALRRADGRAGREVLREPASWRIQATIDEVVVLPCVPVTTNGRRPFRKCSRSAPDMLDRVRCSSSARMASGFSFRIAFPMTTSSIELSMCAAS